MMRQSQVLQVTEEVLEYLKEDHRGCDSEDCEQDVIDGRHNCRIEKVKGLVEIVHLCEDTDGHNLHAR